MFEQAELQGTQMGPNGPPNAKGTAQIAPEIAIYRKPGVFGHFGRFGQNGHFCHFGQPFPIQGGHAEKKSHLGFCLHQRDRATCGFVGVYTQRKPGKIFYCRGCVRFPFASDFSRLRTLAYLR